MPSNIPCWPRSRSLLRRSPSRTYSLSSRVLSSTIEEDIHYTFRSYTFKVYLNGQAHEDGKENQRKANEFRQTRHMYPIWLMGPLNWPPSPFSQDFYATYAVS